MDKEYLSALQEAADEGEIPVDVKKDSTVEDIDVEAVESEFSLYHPVL